MHKARVQKMASSRKRVRYSFDVHFLSSEEREAFQQRLKEVRQRLTPPGSSPIDNCSLMLALFDAVEGDQPQPSQHGAQQQPTRKSFLQNGGELLPGAAEQEGDRGELQLSEN